MTAEQLRRLLDRIPVLSSACDLDLLLFLHRHPRTMLTSESLARFIGHDMNEVARSLDAFIEAGILTRAQNPAHAARLYTLAPGGAHGGWLPSLIQIASTRDGRRAFIAALSGTPLNGTRRSRRPDRAGVVHVGQTAIPRKGARG